MVTVVRAPVYIIVKAGVPMDAEILLLGRVAMLVHQLVAEFAFRHVKVHAADRVPTGQRLLLLRAKNFCSPRYYIKSHVEN